MKFLNKDRVLCIGAHPDDVEYGMAGVFKKCYNTRFEVIVMSGGGDFDNTTTGADRRNENEVIWEMFDGNVKGQVLDKFVKSQDEDSMVNFIENTFTNFDLIVTTPHEDSHFEHRKINNLGPALCRRDLITLVEYRTPSTLNHWIPNHFEGLSDIQYKFKKDALANFKSQQHAPYFHERSIDNFHHNFLCSKKGMDIVEAYRIVENFNK